MDKPLTLTGLKALEKELENELYQFKKKNYDDKVNAFKAQLWEENKIYINAYRTKIEEVTQEIKKKKLELEEKKDPKMKLFQKYVDMTFASGIDFGNKGLTLRYIDPKNRFLIITSNGSTAGQGTAMGTGAYYYANSDHFVAFPQYGGYIDAYLPDVQIEGQACSKRCTNDRFKIEAGRLTNEIKNQMIKQAEEYCTQWNVPAFEITDPKAYRPKLTTFIVK